MGDQWEQGIKGNVGGPMKWGTNEFKQCGGDLWIGGPAGEKGPMRWGTNEMGDQWNGRCVGANWGTNRIGDQWEWDGGPLGLAEIGWMNEKGDQYVVGDLWIGGPMRRGPMSWGTNEMGDRWVGGTNEMGDQWNGWCMGANWGTNEMRDWWVGGPMRWGTNEMGDQWDGGPLGLADDGVTNEKGDQWDGGPVIWGTNEMGDQWAPIMYWGTNEFDEGMAAGSGTSLLTLYLHICGTRGRWVNSLPEPTGRWRWNSSIDHNGRRWNGSVIQTEILYLTSRVAVVLRI